MQIKNRRNYGRVFALHRVLALLPLLVMAGCATPYAKKSFPGGFDERSQGRNQFIVAFAGNGYTTQERAADLCLLRCAEVALGNGFKYFILTANNSEVDRSTSVTTGSYIPTGYGSGVFFSTSQQIAKPGQINTIVCFREKPRNFEQYYTAKSVFEELSAKYYIKKAKLDDFPKPLVIGKSMLGVRFDNKDRSVIRGFDEKSLAKDAGVQIGDKVLAFNEIKFSQTEEIRHDSETWEVGDLVSLKVNRKGQTLTFPVKTIVNTLVIPFRMVEGFGDFPSRTPASIKFVQGPLDGSTLGIVMGTYFDWENPYATLEEFQRKAALIAGPAGADVVQILATADDIKEVLGGSDSRVGFAAIMLTLPKARLGLQYEQGSGYEKRRVIRRFSPGSGAEEAGFLLGDSILAFNGIDALQIDRLNREFLRWEVGQTVEVTIGRAGREIKLALKTIPNVIH